MAKTKEAAARIRRAALEVDVISRKPIPRDEVEMAFCFIWKRMLKQWARASA
jgi:hypothetical protein